MVIHDSSREEALEKARSYLGRNPGLRTVEDSRELIGVLLGAIDRGDAAPHVGENPYAPLGDPRVRKDAHDWDVLRALVVAESVARDGKAPPYLAGLILHADNPRMRMEAILDMPPLGDRAEIREALIASLDDPDMASMNVPMGWYAPRVQEVAACMIIGIGDPSLLREMVRRAVYWEGLLHGRLGHFLPFETRDDLIKAAGQPAVEALVDVVQDEGLLPSQDWLEGHTRSGSVADAQRIWAQHVEHGRGVAAELLVEMAGSEATNALVSVLDSDREPPRGVIKAIGTLRAPSAVGALAKVMGRDRSRAFSTRLAIESIVKHVDDAHRNQVGDQLIDMLTSEDAEVRALGAEQLGKMRYASAAAHLERALSDPEGKVRRAAKRARKKATD